MIGLIDETVLTLLLGIGGILVVATVIALILSLLNRVKHSVTLRNLNQRIGAWWLMAIGLTVTLLICETSVLVLFLLLAFLALREFLRLSPTHRSDHKTVFWLVYILPLL